MLCDVNLWICLRSTTFILTIYDMQQINAPLTYYQYSLHLINSPSLQHHTTSKKMSTAVYRWDTDQLWMHVVTTLCFNTHTHTHTRMYILIHVDLVTCSQVPKVHICSYTIIIIVWISTWILKLNMHHTWTMLATLYCLRCRILKHSCPWYRDYSS